VRHFQLNICWTVKPPGEAWAAMGTECGKLAGPVGPLLGISP
jgi:hypothetical protein